MGSAERLLVVLAGWLAGCADHAPVAPPDAAVRPRGPRPARANAVVSDAVFDTTSLHDVEIEIAPSDLEQLGRDGTRRVPCTFVFDGIAVERAGVRLKGGLGSAQGLDRKPGFSVKLDEFVPGQRLFTLRKLLLDNLQQDEGWVSEHLAYEMYRRAGLAAPRSAYARVTVAGEPYGVYLVREAINKDFLRIWFGSARGNLYEGECCDDLRVGHSSLKNNREQAGDTSDLGRLVDVIDLAPDDRLEAEIEPLLDVDQFLTTWALEALLHHWDGYAYDRNNFYLYRRPDDDRFCFIPHGIDQAFQDTPAQVRRPPIAHLAERMFRIPELEDRWESAMRRILEESWDVPTLLSRVDEAVAVFEGALAEDPRRSRDASEVLEGAEYVREHLRTRPAIVRTMLDATCGNRRVEPAEDCDDGNTETGDGCNALCLVESCGDDVVQRHEHCDGFPCAGDCLGPARCGDGWRENWEACDDGLPAAGDGCSPGCALETCGDGVVQADLGEVCDGDGCRADCTGPGRCGDAAVDWGEDCDGPGCGAGCVDDDCAARWVDDLGWVLMCSGPRDYAGAEARCAHEGLALAAPHDEPSVAAIVREALLEATEPVWIGIESRREPGRWPTDGPWAPEHPSGEPGRLCVAVSDEHAAWIDRDCAEPHPFFCVGTRGQVTTY